MSDFHEGNLPVGRVGDRIIVRHPNGDEFSYVCKMLTGLPAWHCPKIDVTTLAGRTIFTVKGPASWRWE
jgi:hypothetical protein